MRNVLAITVCLLCSSLTLQVHGETKALVRTSFVAKDDSRSFQQMGTGHQRYENNGIQVSHAVVIADFMLADSWSAVGVINGYSDGEQKVGFSELYLK